LKKAPQYRGPTIICLGAGLKTYRNFEDQLENSRSLPKWRRFRVTVRLLLRLKQEKVRLRKNSGQAFAALSPGLDLMVYHSVPFQPTFLHHREAPGSWRNRHQQSSNGRTVGVPIQQEHKDPKSLSPHKDQYPGEKDKIHTRNAYKRRKKKKERGRTNERALDERERERERERAKKGKKDEIKTNRGEETEGRRRTPATSISTILSCIALATTPAAGKLSFFPPLQFNYMAIVAGVRGKFTIACRG
jgi:hypothetical protein